MLGNAESTAGLVIESGEVVTLPRVAQLVMALLPQVEVTCAELRDVSLSRLVIGLRDMDIAVDMAFEQDETVLRIALHAATLDTDDRQARLAPLVFALARALPVSGVLWAGSDLRIPRDVFVAGLSATFGEQPRQAPELAAGRIAPVAPRRIAAQAGARRPRRLSEGRTLRRPLIAPGRPANSNALPGETRYDAHVEAHAAWLRATLLRDADAAELEQAAAERGAVPVEARLSAWAVSLTLATVALPVALPVMAYNITRGEDMRLASLALGVAGLFLALDSSGAMAAVSSF